MRLDGGIDEYGAFGDRYMSDIPPFGRKVIFLNRNGWDSQKEHANRFFKKGDILTVKEIHVGRSSSTVEFVEFPGEEFNTVMFADVESAL